MHTLRLIYLIKNHALSMLLAVVLGALGHLCAIFIPVIGVYAVLFDFKYLWIILVLGFCRGIFRYIEQYFNHLIAFKILADIRHILFKKLRSLGSARSDSKDRGDLMALMSTDVELLEVFFAHTISPLFIALIVSLVILTLMPFKWVTLIAYILIGIFIPLLFLKLGSKSGRDYRSAYSRSASDSYDFAKGFSQIEQFNQREVWEKKVLDGMENINNLQSRLSLLEAYNKIGNDIVVWGSAILLVLIMKHYNYDLKLIIMAFIIHISSFGPLLACSQVVNNLYQTNASAKRVLDFLDEESKITAISDSVNLDLIESVKIKDLSFSYDQDIAVLENLNLDILKGQMIGIKGSSGSGKSTLIKLLISMYDTYQGSILFNGMDMRSINSESLKDKQGIMHQYTDVFSGSIYDNIAMVKEDSNMEQVIEASKKANLHDFVMSLDKGYDTHISISGTNFSSGEKQRMALARLFLYDASLIILDEPSSNLDSLNESILISSLSSRRPDQSVLIVSHRESSLVDCDRIYEMKDGKFTKSLL